MWRGSSTYCPKRAFLWKENKLDGRLRWYIVLSRTMIFLSRWIKYSRELYLVIIRAISVSPFHLHISTFQRENYWNKLKTDISQGKTDWRSCKSWIWERKIVDSKLTLLRHISDNSRLVAVVTSAAVDGPIWQPFRGQPAQRWGTGRVSNLSHLLLAISGWRWRGGYVSDLEL